MKKTIYDINILLAGLRGGGGPTWRGNASPIRTRRHMPEHPQAHTRATSHTDPLSPSLACVEAVVPPGEATLLPSDHGGACQSTSDQRLDHNHDAARNASPRNARRY